MTRQCTFQLATERIIVRIIGDNVLFVDLQNNMLAPIEGLNLNKQGVEIEFPDLKDDPEWKQKAIQRFVDKVKSFETEKEKMDWIISELKQMGYVPLFIQRMGHRPKRVIEIK